MTIAKILVCIGVLAIAGLCGVLMGLIDKMLAEEHEWEVTERRHD